jgi:putative ABC transport system permease protein
VFSGGDGYFSTMGMTVYAGRELREGEHEEGRKLCVINEAFARRFFDRRDPIGLHIIAIDDNDVPTSWQIVGVARNARTRRVRGEVDPRYFVPAGYPAAPVDTPTFLIRTATDPSSVVAGVRNTIRRVNPALAALFARSIDEQMAPQVAQDRTTA